MHRFLSPTIKITIEGNKLILVVQQKKEKHMSFIRSQIEANRMMNLKSFLAKIKIKVEKLNLRKTETVKFKALKIWLKFSGTD